MADNLVTLICGNGNNVSDACKAVGISRKTFYQWKEEHPEWAEQINEGIEVKLDNVESALYKAALEGNVSACIFILKCQAKSRGYSESTDLTLNIPKSVKVEFVGEYQAPIESEDDLPNS